MQFEMPTSAWVISVIQEFDALGWHRTGTSGDDATTQWLIHQLAGFGISAEPMPFRFPKVDVESARIDVSGMIVDGYPQFDAGFTSSGGIDGALASCGEDVRSRIVVVDPAGAGIGGVALSTSELESVLHRHEKAGALGAVIVTRSAGSIAMHNARHIENPGKFPILYVSAADGDKLLQAAASGDKAQLTIKASRHPALASNVYARLLADLACQAEPLVILTPKSGWFHCAVERGCGIAVWLAVARALAAQPSRKRDVVFLATAGHELGYMGIERFLLQRPQFARAHAWIHLGASIGAAYKANLGLRASEEKLQRLALGALERSSAPSLNVWPLGTPAFGEAENIAQRRGRYISLAGGHAYFHTPEDRPDKVSADATAKYAVAAIDMALSLVCCEK